jgi:hypothetical protein
VCPVTGSQQLPGCVEELDGKWTNLEVRHRRETIAPPSTDTDMSLGC